MDTSALPDGGQKASPLSKSLSFAAAVSMATLGSASLLPNAVDPCSQ